MAGVASPLRGHGTQMWRFLGGLTLGGVLGGGLLGLVIFTVGLPLESLIGKEERVYILTIAAIILGSLDIVGRTPQLHRQVPQALRSLSPGVRGLLWGVDLGLVVTTRKTSSLLWLAAIGLLLFQSSSAASAMVGFAMVATFVVGMRVLGPNARHARTAAPRRTLRLVQIGSGLGSFCIALGAGLGAVSK